MSYIRIYFCDEPKICCRWGRTLISLNFYFSISDICKCEFLSVPLFRVSVE